MTNPERRGWLILEETESTQLEAARRVRAGESVGVVFAYNQTHGRGRFGRTWQSERGDSLTVSLVFHDLVDHPRPWTIGMAVAVAAAQVFDCHNQWPNDLVEDHQKIGGILTEIVTDHLGRRIPVVGIGINLNQVSFPEDIRNRAASLRLIHGHQTEPMAAAHALLQSIEEIPCPQTWRDISDLWMKRDATPGKTFKLGQGQTAVATGIGEDGELICDFEGRKIAVHAADAYFGPPI